MEDEEEVAPPGDTNLADNEPIVHRADYPELDDVGDEEPDPADEEEDSEPDTTEEAETPEEETETEEDAEPDTSIADKIAAIRAKAGDDPEKLAKQLANLQELMGRQSQELGTLRGNVPNGTNAAPQITYEEAIKPVFQKPQGTPWHQLPVNPETGLILVTKSDGTHEDHLPLDDNGVEFYPPSYWAKRGEQLTEQYEGNPAYAATKLMEERQQKDAEYRGKLNVKAGVAYARQGVVVDSEASDLAKVFGREHPAPIAKGLADGITKLARAGINKEIAEGRLEARFANDPAAIRNMTNMILAQKYKDGTLATDAKKMAAESTATPPKNGKAAPASNGKPMPKAPAGNADNGDDAIPAGRGQTKATRYNGKNSDASLRGKVVFD